MYAPHFGLTQDPFSIAPDPRYLYMSERHREALAHLLYGVGGGGGFVLLTGDIGAGKTTVCRCFLEQIPARCHVAYIFNPKLTVTELLQSVCEEFGIGISPSASGSPKDYIDTLNRFLLTVHGQGGSTVLIIDEAQNLSADVLEQLRLLTNLETNDKKLLQIVLIGQPELRAMLARPELEQLAQRVIARYHLDALSEPETAQYIQHRLGVAGLKGPLPFDGAALRRIWVRSRGVPRRINLLCDRALLGAWAHGARQVNRATVDQAANEVFDLDTASPHAPRPSQTRGLWLLVGGMLLGLGGAGIAYWAAPPLHPATGQPALSAASRPASAPPSAVADGAHPPASTVASSAAVPMPPPAIQHLQLDASLLQRMPGDDTAAWQALAAAWGLAVDPGNPCAPVPRLQARCLRVATQGLTLPVLRQLNRPGLLGLQAPGGLVYAVLVGLEGDRALLRVDTQLHSVPLLALSNLWSGDFASYWEPPPGYNPQLSSDGKWPAVTVRWIRSRLDMLDGHGVAEPVESRPERTLDAGLRRRLQAFQRAQGLKADGLPGPITLMQLARITGSTEPTLTPAPH